MERILVLEDAADSQLIIRSALGNRFDLHMVSTVHEARTAINEVKFDLIILDACLPDGDGFSFCGELQSNPDLSDTPIFFTTGKTDLSDKLLGFSLGAEDYITKPFEPLELRARVNARLEKARSRRNSKETIRKGELRLDLAAMKVFKSEAGREQELTLTPYEFKILVYLARNEGRVLSREQLLQSVWGGGLHVLDRTVDRHVSSLRHKLGDHSRVVETVSGAGYRFSPERAKKAA